MKTSIQWIAVVTALFLVLLLYFGFDTKPSTFQESTELESFEVDIQSEKINARKVLDIEHLKRLDTLEAQANILGGDTLVAILKELSGEWYRLGNPLLAGHYASEVAQIENTAESWSIAATTYAAGLRDPDPSKQSVSFDEASKALQEAIDLEPTSSIHKVNLALLYAEKPPPEEPMKGIQMLLALNESDPNDVLVLNTLGRLAIRTGQWERAQKRLETAIELQPENTTTICLLADVYLQIDDIRGQELRDKCELLTLKN